VVRQLLASGLLAVKGDHGTLALTDLSAEVLRGERQVTFRRDAPRPAVPAAAARGGRSQKAGAGGSGRADAGGSGRADAGGSGRAKPVVSPAELPPSAEPLFERLRAWRAAVAKEQGLPAYVIFHDATLRQIAVSLPSTLAELSGVNGVGETKLARYGSQVLEILAEAAPGSAEAPEPLTR
jgi:ATP-dependent DNA helicase RecQ